MSANSQSQSTTSHRLEFADSRNNIHSLSLRFPLNVLRQLGSPLLNTSARRYNSGNHLNAFRGQRFGDAAPVMQSRQVRSSNVQLIETEKSMRQDDGILGGLVVLAQSGEVVFDEMA